MFNRVIVFFFSLFNNGLLQRSSDRVFFLPSRNAPSHKGALRDNTRRLIVLWGFLGPVHTNALSKVCLFVVIENASIDSRPHYRFDAFSTVRTKTVELQVVT